jgi:hypothetical protein
VEIVGSYNPVRLPFPSFVETLFSDGMHCNQKGVALLLSLLKKEKKSIKLN